MWVQGGCTLTPKIDTVTSTPSPAITSPPLPPPAGGGGFGLEKGTTCGPTAFEPEPVFLLLYYMIGELSEPLQLIFYIR